MLKLPIQNKTIYHHFLQLESSVMLCKHQDNIVFLAASVDEDKNKWKLDIKNKKSDVTQWWIANSDALRMLGVDGIPRFMMIDPQGKIYNANMPRPNETSFYETLDKVAESKSFSFDF